MNVGLISLGCAKNLVDSEFILGILKTAGCQIVSDPDEADAIIINTCGFIEAAKQETIETIREMKEYGKKLVVCGCYAQRYKDKLMVEMPFIDRIITLQEYPKIHLILSDLFHDPDLKFQPLRYESRILTGSVYSPYVKISEGCDNRCTYCAIPLIRGKFRSRNYQEIIDECKKLVQDGAKEINLIGQDTSKYGTDLPEGKLLEDLIREITVIPGVFLVRVLYLYPDEITDPLLDEIRNNPKVAKYFDIPIQHICTPILKRMNRRGDEAFLSALLLKIRNMIPEAIFRTTLIVGFPGETEQDFEKLVELIKGFQFDRLGAFSYSKEDDTLAYDFPDQVQEEVKQKRLDTIMKVQSKIAWKKNREQISKTHLVLVEAYDEESKFYYGRSYAFAPDDIDGYIVFQSVVPLSIGDVTYVLIKDSIRYDLIGDAFSEVR